MKFLLAFLLTAVLSFLAGMFVEWWSIAIVAFAVALFIPQNTGRAFLSGFLAIFLMWGLLALVIDIKNESILSYKIALLLKIGSSVLLILITALVGAIVGGFAAMAGSALRPVRKLHH